MSTISSLVTKEKAEPRYRKLLEFWKITSVIVAALLALFLVFPMWQVFKESVIDADGGFTMANFVRFFSKSYYFKTILNSFILSVCVTAVSLAIGIPFSYFYSYFRIRGARFLFIGSILSAMSAPFIGAYAWILLMGRNGVLTNIIEAILPIKVGSIYGFGGLVLVLSLKLFPFITIYMNAAFRNLDRSMFEASALMGVTGIKRFFRMTVRLTLPTLLAASLLVFMRAFADFGTPIVIGEGFRTFPVQIYQEYLGEIGQNHQFASAIGVIGIVVTAAVFLFQRFLSRRFSYSLSAGATITQKKPRGIRSWLMHGYMYGLVGLALLPQLYVAYLSFRKNSQTVFFPGYTFDSYREAGRRLLGRSLFNTTFYAAASVFIIIVLAIVIAYLVVRRFNTLNSLIDTTAMLPYIMPGAVIGIALVLAFNTGPIAITGSMAIMILALVIRRMPYTIRSATATLQQLPMSLEEASRSLGASKIRTFTRITVPLMGSGIASGAILSLVTVLTEMSAGIILYNNSTITLTMSAYVAISRGNYGLATAFSTVLMVLTILILGLYLRFTKEEEVRL